MPLQSAAKKTHNLILIFMLPYVSAKGRPRPEAPQANYPDIIASSIFIWLFGHITFATNLLVSI
jgi:hypothetical protein